MPGQRFFRHVKKIFERTKQHENKLEGFSSLAVFVNTKQHYKLEQFSCFAVLDHATALNKLEESCCDS